MGLIVYENSYMTLEEANDIVSKSFLSSSKERQFWDGLTDSDKEILIINATDQVDVQQSAFRGNKVNSKQNMEWPRVINGNNTDTPYSIKKGILLNIIKQNLLSMTDEGKLIAMGVKSFADGGGAKIEFNTESTSSSEWITNKVGIFKNIWKTYFSDWSYIV